MDGLALASLASVAEETRHGFELIAGIAATSSAIERPLLYHALYAAVDSGLSQMRSA